MLTLSNRNRIVAALALAGTAFTSAASAQEIQITGPLAGAPAVRQLRLHREDRLEVAPSVSFTLLDEYQRTIMVGARIGYHLTDWLGIGAFGGYGFHYTTSLTDEIQEKAIDARKCSQNESDKQCLLTARNLTRSGSMADDQLGAFNWMVAPQVTFIPFRGKLAFFSEFFVDADVYIFAGPAIVGVEERAECGPGSDGSGTCANNFALESRVAVAPTVGLGVSLYPSDFIGFGAEWRATPFSWNTSGFDNLGGGNGGDFPDGAVDGDDRELRLNSMLTIGATFYFPTAIRTTE